MLDEMMLDEDSSILIKGSEGDAEMQPEEFGKSLCDFSAGGGHLAVLKGARAHGCPWNEDTCAYAAKNGHLEILKWARANGCPWNEDTCAYAAKNGHLEILKWARNGYMPSSTEGDAM